MSLLSFSRAVRFDRLVSGLPIDGATIGLAVHIERIVLHLSMKSVPPTRGLQKTVAGPGF